MKAGIGMRRRALTTALMIAASVAGQTSVLAQEIRFMPIRVAPLGSPVGTVGEPVSPVFNNSLDCWELTLTEGGVEVDIDVQGGGWGHTMGSLPLGVIQATVLPDGYENGIGAPLNPKGWPGSPEDGIYQAHLACSGSGDPCVPPFDETCGGGAGGSCLHNPNWIMPPCTDDFRAVAWPTLEYAWATVVRIDCNHDPDPSAVSPSVVGYSKSPRMLPERT